jgi:hypothetical protein
VYRKAKHLSGKDCLLGDYHSIRFTVIYLN